MRQDILKLTCTFFHPGPYKMDVCRNCGDEVPAHRVRMEMAIEEQQGALEHMINCTPTGELRNKLTEINIHLLAAISTFKEIP